MPPIAPHPSSAPPWHILDVGSPWIKEFAHSLHSLTPLHSWCPDHRIFGHFEDWQRPEFYPDPPLRLIRFPMQRGYSRFPLNRLLPYGPALVNRMLRDSAVAHRATLLCTAPYYAPLAEAWPGPVVYYLTDLTKKYDGADSRQVVDLDRRMARIARAVHPNSESIAAYLRDEAGCPASKITVIPNATRAANIPAQPLLAPQPLPADVADLPRPVIGIIGNLAANIDWPLVSAAIALCRDVTWIFIGPYTMPVRDPHHSELRRALLATHNTPSSRVRFLGSRPYPALAAYARSFDVALIPYANAEPTISGSATRFYEHLAACRPILATPFHRELATKEPFVKLVSTANQIAAAIESLRATGFRDGLESSRWTEAHKNTWTVRAKTIFETSL